MQQGPPLSCRPFRSQRTMQHNQNCPGNTNSQCHKEDAANYYYYHYFYHHNYGLLCWKTPVTPQQVLIIISTWHLNSSVFLLSEMFFTLSKLFYFIAFTTEACHMPIMFILSYTFCNFDNGVSICKAGGWWWQKWEEKQVIYSKQLICSH